MKPTETVSAVDSAYDVLTAKVRALALELPGISFGYVGNCGVDRGGAFDDRSWRIFLPHPNRIGEPFRDDVSLGRTEDLPKAVAEWSTLEFEARRRYAREVRR